MTVDVSCRRCGECCRRGGPALHGPDLAVVDLSGGAPASLGPGDLFTIRPGELTRDTPSGDAPLRATPGEIIKIRGVGLARHEAAFARRPDWTCVFLEHDAAGAAACAIYEIRPEECRILDCADASGLIAMYRHDRVSRADIVPPQHPMSHVIALHEAECGLAAAGEAARQARRELQSGAPEEPADGPGDESANGPAVEALLRMIRYDAALRVSAAEKLAIPADHMLFYLGRPLSATIAMFGVRATRVDGRLTARTSPTHIPCA